MRDLISQIVSSIRPYDTLEEGHILSTVEWIASGEEIFRIEKPDTPPKHLVSYFVLIDPVRQKIMLVDHIKANLWLPAGGHVEKNEHPKDTVKREILEELNITADLIIDDPFFLTETITVGSTAGHTDVTLWYLLKGDHEMPLDYDKEEFNGYKWFDLNEILEMDASRLDPCMHRFTKKLLAYGNILSLKISE